MSLPGNVLPFSTLSLPPSLGYPVGAQTAAMVGSGESMTQREAQFFHVCLRGPDCEISTKMPIMIHMIEVTRVWFTCPTAGGFTSPLSDTLFLRIDQMKRAPGKNIVHGGTAFSADPLTGVKDATPDVTGEDHAKLYPGTVLAFPTGVLTGGGMQVQAANLGRLQIYLHGAHVPSKALRFQLLQLDGSVYAGGAGNHMYVGGPGGGPVRVFIEGYVYGESKN